MNETIDQTQAVALANEELSRNGIDVANYDIEIDGKMSQGPHWMIWYERKGPYRMPGGRHAVKIDKNTGQAVFMKGQ